MALYYHTRRRALPTCLWRRLLSSSSSSFSSPKIPLLWKSNITDSQQSVTVQLYSWGRGASGQLGGGIEEIRIYPSPVASFSLSPNFRLSAPIPGRLPSASSSNVDVAIGISCGLFHSALLVDENLWIWGKGDGGRLGFGHENPAFVPTLNTNLDFVRSVALGGLHSVALNSLGQVFTWGYGGFGALGHSVYHRELAPRLVEGSWDAEICHVATSGTHTAAITKSGELYTWGRDEGDGRLGLGPGRGPNEAGGLSVPSKVKALPVRVAAVSCGGFFTLALSDDGELWDWGEFSGGFSCDQIANLAESVRGRFFQQLFGDIFFKHVSPSRRLADMAANVESFRNTISGETLFPDEIQHLRHLLNKLDSSSVAGSNYIQSANSNYELGRGDKLGGWKPQPVPSLKGVRVMQIASGGYHSLALTDKGEVLSWGHGGHGQLGNSSLQNQKVPVPVDALANEKVIYISCGGSSSAAITDGGKLYMWGNARDCQLGVPGLPEIQSSPVEVKFLMEDDGLGDHSVLSVAIGASHAMCLVSRSGG